MKKNYVFMIAVDKSERSKSQGYQYSLKAWKRWCEKNDCELFVLDEEIYSSYYMAPQWFKVFVFDLLENSGIDLNDVNRVLYVDCDTVPHPNTPNILADTENFPLGVFYAVRNYGSMDWVCRSIENYCIEFNNGSVYPWYRYFNSGFMLFDPSHREFFETVQAFYVENQNKLVQMQKQLGVGKDQPVLNLIAHKNNIDIQLLGYKYNMQDLMRFELVGDDMLFLRHGYIYHFNCGVKPSPGYWIERTFKHLYEHN